MVGHGKRNGASNWYAFIAVSYTHLDVYKRQELFFSRNSGEKTTMGGLALNTLKKLNGAKFACPLASVVLAKAMGRGATALNK